MESHNDSKTPLLIGIVSGKWVKLLTIAVGGVLLASAGYLAWTWNHSLLEENRMIVIESGTSMRAFAQQLRQQRLIPNTFSLILLAHIKGQARQLKAGEYGISSGTTMRELLDQVIAGRVIKYPLVLIEGWTFAQFLETIKGLPKLEHSLDSLSNKTIMRRLGMSETYPEGMFYPDTYYYTNGTTDYSLLRLAHEKLQNRLQQEWENRAPKLPLRNKYEALVLASIVEKETGKTGERKMIAGVFINRLRKHMRLQSDPTVIYGMGDSFNGNIRLVDLRRDTPYNTYTRRGLPPTPIAMPGGGAINAVMHPADTRALYFVSRGDGSHVFSQTLREHNIAVDKYQRRRPSRTRSQGNNK